MTSLNGWTMTHVGGVPINNPNGYNVRMSASMPDKIDYIIQHTNTDIYVDYGCADGATMIALHQHRPDALFIGYDIDSVMLKTMVRNITAYNETASPKMRFGYSGDWVGIRDILDRSPGTRTLILNSVIHEIYAYMNRGGVGKEWSNIMDSGFDYVCIRDMFKERAWSERGMSNEFWNSMERLRGRNDPIAKRFDEYSQYVNEELKLSFGYTQMTEFLLKYDYVDNWEREMREQYFKLDYERILEGFQADGKYDMLYLERYSIPFIANKVSKMMGFGFDFNQNTHTKMVFELRLE